ncbi:11-beta-hydroxysteroid dehydrogenase 1A-like isoform X2 [Wolffia australiana]
MDLKNKFLNLATPPAVVLFLSIVVPFLYIFRQVGNLFSVFFSENLRNKVVLITGASSGIGEQVAYEYARKGARLVLVARREDRLQETAERSRHLGSPDVLVVCADVASPDDCRHFFEAALTRFGKLDHLVNNAGIASGCLFEEVENIADFKQVMDINFWGLVYPTHFALEHLKKSRGKILVTSSVASWLPMPRMSFYNASKAALTAFYETLRVEMGRDVGVTIASPSWTESEMTQGKMLAKEGQIQVDPEMRDVGVFPRVQAEACAKEMVEAACMGKRHVTVPAWFQALHLCQLLAPEAVEWWLRFFYLTRLGNAKKTPSKKAIEATAAKEVLYPSSLQSSEIKKD